MGDSGRSHMNLNYDPLRSSFRRIRDVTGKYPGFYTNPLRTHGRDGAIRRVVG